MGSDKIRFIFPVERVALDGLSLCTLNYCYVLTDLGYEVTLVILSGESDIEIKQKKHLTIEAFSQQISLQELAELYGQFDVVIVQNSPMAPFEFEATRFASKPLVVELLHSELKAGQCPSTDMTIAVSQEIFNYMQPRKHDVLVSNGVDTQLFHPPEKRTPSDRVTLIQVAQIGKRMFPNLEQIGRELITEGLPINVRIVGRDGESSEHITYLGIVKDQKTVVKLLQEADILLHLSDMESFGMTAIEAMATGTIPIVSNIGGLPFSVINGETGFVVELDDSERVKEILRELVGKIRESHSDVTSMIDKGIRRVHEQFDLVKNITKAVTIIENNERTFERKNRIDSYPFSFLAPILYLLKGKIDRYFTVMEGIYSVEDPQEAFARWREFLQDIQPEWRNVPADYWNFFDKVYSSMALEGDERVNRKRIYNYWLALLAVTFKKYDLALSFLQRGKEGTRMTQTYFERVFLGILIQANSLKNEPFAENILKIGGKIKGCYLLDDELGIEGIGLESSIIEEFFQAAEHPDLMAFLGEIS